MSFNDTTTYPTTITYQNRFLKILQPTNSNFEYRISPDELMITTNFASANVFYMNSVALDWNLITSPTAANRDLMITAIENLILNPAVSISGPVTISGTVPVSIAATVPVNIIPTATGAYYTIQTTTTSASLTPTLAIKVTSASPTAKMVLSSISAGSTASLGSGIGVEVRLTKNPTVTGGTFTNFSTSIVQTNTTFTSTSAGTDFQSFLFKQSLPVVDLTPLNLTFLNNDILVISISNNGILGNSGVQLNFSQNS